MESYYINIKIIIRLLMIFGVVTLVINKILAPKYSLKKIDRNLLGNEIISWEEVIKCRDYKFNRTKKNTLIDFYNIRCPKCKAENRKQEFFVVEYSTPEESWLHLAGRRGPLFICKHHLDQIEFIVLILS